MKASQGIPNAGQVADEPATPTRATMKSRDGVHVASKKWRVIIVGGGFGGLRAARALKSAPVAVTLIDRRNYHLFQPLLYQVATGSLSAGQIAAPLRSVLSRQKNVRVLLGEVVDINPAAKWIQLVDGARCEYDSLIVAAGSQLSYYGQDAWREWAPGLKGVEAATNIRNAIFYAFEVAERLADPVQRRAWLRFVIVGGGTTGVEVAGAIGEIARQTLRRDFRSIHSAEAEIIVLEAAPRLLMTFPEDLARKAARSLARLDVQVRTGVMVKAIDREGVTFESDQGSEHLDSRTVIWAGGVRASELGRTLAKRTAADTDKSGRIKVNPDLTVDKFPDLYVVGDLALALGPDGKPLPGVAQVAMQQGAYAAKAIVSQVRGAKAPPPFKYLDKGQLAVIGRGAAVADIFGWHVSGLLAWLVWVFIHLMYIVQFRNRLLVLTQWAAEYLTFSRGARLITGPAAADFDFGQETGFQEGERAEG
jgi:NADH dehydrogenase